MRVAGGTSEEFGVGVGVHQGAVLSPLLFVNVLDVVSENIRRGLPWELLYADDLVIVAETEEELKERLTVWKDCLEGKGLKVNMGKTKVMKCSREERVYEKSGRWPCAVCRKGVGVNSVECGKCRLWVHARCSGMRGKLESVGFECKRCKGLMVDRKLGSLLGDNLNVQWVEKFCYLGDVLRSDGGAESAVIQRGRSGWKKFREIEPLLTARGISFRLRGRLYEACVRTAMVYGSETWEMKKDLEEMMERTEKSMLRRMFGLEVDVPVEEMRERLGIVGVKEAMRRNRLRWYGHVARKEEDDWVRKSMEMQVAGSRMRGRPRKTWRETVREDMREKGLRESDVDDRVTWRNRVMG